MRIQQYIQLPDKQRAELFALDSLEPKNLFLKKGSDIGSLTYDQVKSVIRRLSQGDSLEVYSDVFQTVFGITQEEFFKGDIVEFYSAKNFVVQAFQKILDNEKKLTSGVEVDSALWEQAGGRSLSVFSDIIPLNQLAKVYGLYPIDLKDRKYSEIFTLLLLEKTQAQVESNYNKLKKG